jgi:hypothetical protein
MRMPGADVQHSISGLVQERPPAVIRVRQIFLEVLSIALFILAYFLPLLLDLTDELIQEKSVAALIDDLLATSAAQFEIARNVLGHLLPLMLVYWLTSRLARGLSSLLRIKYGLVRVALLLVVWMLMVSANALLFSKSNYSLAFGMLASPFVAWSLAALLVGAFCWVALRTWARRHFLIAGCAAAASVAGVVAISPAHGTTTPAGKNIVIVGVDSLSAAAAGQLGDQLPHLNGLLQSSTQYTRAYTPLARTFPAWMSILSGKAPAETRAIFNLRNLDQVERDGLLSTDLQGRGYRTVYAIDERRFNHINESFGFDRLVGPEAGALDFVIQRLNDTPLSNLMLQTAAGRALMPFSFINTASYINYDDDEFVDLVLQATAGAPQLFLAVHFESAHFPFKTRHAQRDFDSPNEFWNQHAEALTVVDEQVGQLIDGLSRQGYLQDSLVVLLSDHGEGLGESEGEITVGGVPRDVRGFGHGDNILSDLQNRIILGTIAYQNGLPVNQPGAVDQQVSLLDIRRLVSSYLESGASNIQAAESCLIVETGIRAAPTVDYTTLNEAALAASLADYYEIESRGRMWLREDRLSDLVNAKDIGVRCADHLTWWSVVDSNYFSVRLTDAGGFSTEQAPPKQDIERIEAYRARLQQSLQPMVRWAKGDRSSSD